MEKKVSNKGFDSVEEYNYDSWASNSKQLSILMTDSKSNSYRIICNGYIPSRQMLFHTFAKPIKYCSFLSSRLA